MKNIIKILILVFCLMLAACGQSSDKLQGEQQSAQGMEEVDEEPKQLMKIEEDIEKIIRMLGGPVAADREDGGGQQGGSGSQGGQGGQGQQGQEQGQGQQGQEGQQGQGQQQDQSQGGQQGQDQSGGQSGDTFKQVTETITGLHYKWSDYLPTATKMGAKNSQLEGFSNSLNQLTTVIESKDKQNSLVASNGLYAHLPELYDLYKEKKNLGDVKRVKHFIRSVVINSMSNNFSAADSDIEELSSIWETLKEDLPEGQKKAVSELSFSISELKKVVGEQNMQLIDLKGRVALHNVDEIEIALDKNKT